MPSLRPALTACSVLLLLVTAQLYDAVRGGGLVGAPPLLLATALAAYVVGVAAGPRTAGAAVLLAAVLLTTAHQRESPGAYPVLDDFVFALLTVAAPAVAGALVRARAHQVRELRRLAALLSAQREAEVEAVRIEERNRLELRLHRGFGEQVAGIAMRAESVRGADDAAVRAALADVEAAARQSLEELRTALGSLRGPAPLPTADLPEEAEPALVDPLGARDVWLALVCGIATAAETVVSADSRGPVVLNVAAALLAGAPLVVRRARPVVACAGTLSALLVMAVWLTPPTAMVTPILTMLVCGYAAGAGASGLRRAAALAVVMAGSVLLLLAAPPGAQDADGLVPLLAAVALAALVGRVGAGWVGRAAAMRSAVAELERGREVAVELAVAEQRNRLASQLHDTVAHAMTVICLQASAGQVTPDRSHLDTVLATAHAGLAELRTGLDNLGDSHELGVAGIAALARRAGLDPDVSVTGGLGDIPPASRTLALRVLREAVTNAARYAPASRLRVDVAAAEDRLRLRVVDEGGAAPPEHVPGAGAGLRGLAVEVARTGGELSWGPEGAGFRVEAALPLLPLLPADEVLV